jgi:hypothetical protein
LLNNLRVLEQDVWPDGRHPNTTGCVTDAIAELTKLRAALSAATRERDEASREVARMDGINNDLRERVRTVLAEQEAREQATSKKAAQANAAVARLWQTASAAPSVVGSDGDRAQQEAALTERVNRAEAMLEWLRFGKRVHHRVRHRIARVLRGETPGCIAALQHKLEAATERADRAEVSSGLAWEEARTERGARRAAEEMLADAAHVLEKAGHRLETEGHRQLSAECLSVASRLSLSRARKSADASTGGGNDA